MATSKSELAKRWTKAQRDAHDQINGVRATIYEGFKTAGNEGGGAMYLFDLGVRFAMKYPEQAKEYLAQEEALVFNHFQQKDASTKEVDLRQINESYVDALVEADAPVIEATRRVSADRDRKPKKSKELVN